MGITRRYQAKKSQPEGWLSTMMRKFPRLLLGQAEHEIDQLRNIRIGDTG